MSKKCCYLCDLYIKFAQDRGYKINISGTHKKIYHGWKLPITEDNVFKKASLAYLLSNLDQIIRNKINQIEFNANIMALSDSSGGSGDFDVKDSDVEDSDSDDEEFEKALLFKM